MLKTLQLMVAIASMAFCTNALAQGCATGGCGGPGYGYAPVNVGSCGGELNNCGREISQGSAAALWGDYCTESCDSGGTGCKLFGKLKGKFSGGGCGAGACGCDQGCFGYPVGGGCGCGGGAAYGGGYGADTCGGCDQGRSCGCGGGGLKAKLGGKLGGGCGCCKKRKRGGDCGCDPCAVAPVALAGSVDTCGCNGGGGNYFAQPVGYDYGTAGMHSVVNGCASGACGGGCNGAPMAPVMGQPVMSQPAQGPMIEGQAIEAAAEPGAITAGDAAGN